MRRCIEENARLAQDQDTYERKYSELMGRITSLNEQITEIDDEVLERAARRKKIRRFLQELGRGGDIVTEFDENLWNATVDSLTVRPEKEVVITFRDGTEIPVTIQEDK